MKKIKDNNTSIKSDVYIPNKETIKAIKEGRKIAHDKSSSHYKSIEDLKKALDIK